MAAPGRRESMRGIAAGRGARSLVALLLAGLGLLAPSMTGGGLALATFGASHLQIVVLSNRADLVSGGDALVQVEVPARVSPSRVRVQLNGQDVTSSFAVRSDGRFIGLVGGLRDGRNELTARAFFLDGARIAITNHPS